MPRKKAISPVPPPPDFVPSPSNQDSEIAELKAQIAALTKASLPKEPPKPMVIPKASSNTPRSILLAQLTQYRIETQALWATLGLEERRQRASAETEMMTTLAKMPADKVLFTPTVDKTNFPDRTQELHNLADQGGWYALKKLYFESKCNHMSFLGDPASTLVTKAVKSGDLELIKEMIADGALVDIPSADPVSPLSARQWVQARGRKTSDMGQPQSMAPLAGESPGRPRMSNNVALYDFLCWHNKQV